MVLRLDAAVDEAHVPSSQETAEFSVEEEEEEEENIKEEPERETGNGSEKEAENHEDANAIKPETIGLPKFSLEPITPRIIIIK